MDVSKPGTKELAPFFSKLRPLVNAATPVVSNFSEAISKPGSGNDLTEAALALPELAHALVTASPNGVRALEESLPVTALFGPYMPDLEGFIRAFGQTGAYYDANGHYARVGGFPRLRMNSENTLKPAEPAQVLKGLKTGQLRRCPGAGTQPAADGSSPFTDNGQLGCDPTQTPMNRRRSNSLAGSPLLIGARHDADRGRSPCSSPTTPTTACRSRPPTTSRCSCRRHRVCRRATRCASAARASA